MKRKIIALFVLIVAALIFMAARPAQASSNDDQVAQVCSFAGFKWTWADGQLGSQHQYTVPKQHTGHIWTLLVIKAGALNTMIENPIPGHVYFPANDENISYVILCKEMIPEETTTTTVVDQTSTTVVDQTTTTVSDIGTPLAPPSVPVKPVLPATGRTESSYILIAWALFLVGAIMVAVSFVRRRS